MTARTGDWMGSAQVAGMRTNAQRTVSGNRSTMAMTSANKNAPNSNQAVHRITHGGGSCGNISDSASSDPRSVNCELICFAGSDSQLLARKIVIQAALCHQLFVISNLGYASLL